MPKALNRHQFGVNAEKYATSAVHAKGASLAALVTAMAPEPDWRLLDVATAAGHTALAFAPHVAEVVAGDLTPQMLDVARAQAEKKGASNISFEIVDAENLCFDDASFNAVTCRIAPHHFPDIAKFLAEVRRVLKPGGKFGLVDNVAPDTRTTAGFTSGDLDAAAEDYNLFEKLRDPSHFRALQFTEWLASLEAAGFRVTHHEVLAKPMGFLAWAERMQVNDQTLDELVRMIEEGSSAFRAYLRPEQGGNGLTFTLSEGLFVCEA